MVKAVYILSEAKGNFSLVSSLLEWEDLKYHMTHKSFIIPSFEF
jgi:hypothetical protein